MMPLAPADRAKLSRILGLLGSDQPGEVVAAAHAANRLVKGAGLSWVDVLGGGETSRRHEASSRPAGFSPASDHVADLHACGRRPDLLTAWELAFVADLAQRRSLTARQRAVLAGIADKVRRTGPRPG